MIQPRKPHGMLEFVDGADYDALAALIDEHNSACAAACEAQRDAGRCHAYMSRGLRCPDCPRDWQIDRAADSAESVPLTPDGHCAKCGGTVGLSHHCTAVSADAGRCEAKSSRGERCGLGAGHPLSHFYKL